MTSTVGRVNYLARTLVYGGLVALLGWGGFELRDAMQTNEREIARREERIAELGRDLAARDERIAAMGVEIEALQAHVRELEAALRLLKVDHRLARLRVTDQRPAPGKPGGVETDVVFQELGADGKPLGEALAYTLAGKKAYVDALVIKFEDDYVERGDALRGSSLCLFFRLFSENQFPSQGFPLDSVGQRPTVYGADDATPAWESALWQRFWDYANDPEAAAALGVRAMHGEAPYVDLRAGRSYVVELRASGGLSLRPE
ncbi:MAG: hypothetical protein ACYTG2_11105 [Planctomycetota bacterium]|jgi:hypothetical protein